MRVCVVTLLCVLSLGCVHTVLAEDPGDSNDEITEVVESSSGVFYLLGPAFGQAFAASLSMILVSELGDKTFFIAAIMAMRHPRMVIWSGAIGALGLMTVLSALMGHALPSLLPKEYTHYAACLLFLVFGVRLIKDAMGMEAGGVSDELEEVEAELGKKDEDEPEPDVEAPTPAEEKKKKKKEVKPRKIHPAFLQSFSLTFLAEWGDRSQIATIALAAAKDPIGVTVGGILGHAICTGLAVIGGRMLATKISERTVSFLGGFLFLIFAVAAYVQGPDGSI